MSVRCPQTNLQIRIIKKKSLRGRKDFQCRYVYQYLKYYMPESMLTKNMKKADRELEQTEYDIEEPEIDE